MAVFTAAAAVFTAVSTWVSGLSALGAFALKTAVGVGLSLAAQALAGKPKTEDKTFSLSTSLSGGGALSRSFIMGRAATGGSIVWTNTWGQDGKSPNAWLTQVIALSDMPVRGLAEVWVDGVKVDWNPAGNNDTIYGYQVSDFNSDGANMYIKFYDGTQTTYDSALVTIDSTQNRSWNIDRVGDGIAYVIVRTRATKNQFSGIPNCVFVVDGMRLYDASKDSTNGGDGPQRYSVPATWGGDGDDLPAVQLYNLMRGIYYKGQWIYGFQRMSAQRLDDTWITAINKCRLPVQGASGLEPQYRSGGEIIVSARLSEAMDTLLTACQGEVAESGGIYSLRVGEPEPPLFSITDADIISTDEQRFTPFYGLAESINGIAGTYPEPLENWSEKSAPPIYRPDLEALDGNRRLLANVEFTFVPYAEQVQRLMKSALLSAMRTRRHTLTLPPKFWRYCVPGDTLRWTSERNGYNNKLFIIKGVVDRDSLECVIDVLEWEPSDYSWSSSTEFQPPVIGSLGPIIPSPQPILDWNALPYIIRDQLTAARRPAIRLVWDASSDALIGVRAVEWEVRILGQTDLVSSGSSDQPSRGSAIISAGILPNTIYEARGRFIPDDDSRETLWSEWISVLTDDVKLGTGDIEVELGTIGDDAKSVWQALGQQLDDVWKRVEHLGQSQTLEGAVGEVSRREIKAQVGVNTASIVNEAEVRANETSALARTSEEIRARTALAEASIISERLSRADADSALATRIDSTNAAVAGNAASLASETTARVNADSALGTRIDTTNANVGANAAAIQNESTVRAGADSALATQITAVRAEIEGAFADGAIRFEAVAAPGGVNARYSLLVRGSVNGDYLESGFFLEIYTEGGVLKSRMNVVAQQFSIAAGTSATPVFAVIAGEVYMINAKIQQAQIDNLIVGTSNLAPSAVTAFNYNRVATGPLNTTGNFMDQIAVTLNHGLGSPPVEVLFSGRSFGGSGTAGATLGVDYQLYAVEDGVTIASNTISMIQGQPVPHNTFVGFHSPNPSRATTNYTFRTVRSQQSNNVQSVDMYIRALAMKR